MKKKAFLVVGDKRATGHTLDHSFNDFCDTIDNSRSIEEEIHITGYKNIFSGDLPEISRANLTILLFFPYKYWNKKIEVYGRDSKVYGDNTFGQEFKKYFIRVENIIKQKYSDKTIQYVNPPDRSILDRDKQASKMFFRRHDIPTPRSFEVETVKDVHRIVDRGWSMYIKPRFGAMGKGITYLSNGLMYTNFLVRKGKIISHPYDYHWRFHEINNKNKERFLKKLLTKGFIFEEAIDPPIRKGRRMDFRVYCIKGKVCYYYIRSAPIVSLVTNWSQGGKIEQKKDFVKYIPKVQLARVRSLARKTARSLALNYTGIDIIFSKDYKEIYVLEAHSFPGYEKGYNLMRTLAKRILK